MTKSSLMNNASGNGYVTKASVLKISDYSWVVMATETRVSRRKAETRAKLITAAQQFLVDGNVHPPILEITKAADVGMGSFYNHFSTREELFDAAVAAAREPYAQAVNRLTQDMTDQAEVFATGFRITGRMFRCLPALGRIILKNGTEEIFSDSGMTANARRNMHLAIESGRFAVADPELALAVGGGAMIAVGQLLLDDPSRDDAASIDQVCRDLLQMFGIEADEAERLVNLPLPDLDQLALPGS